MVDDIPEKVDKDESTITAGGTRKKLIKHFSALSLVTTKTFFVAECFFVKITSSGFPSVREILYLCSKNKTTRNMKKIFYS